MLTPGKRVHLFKQSLAVTLRKGTAATGLPRKKAAPQDAPNDQECGAEEGPTVSLQRSDMVLYEKPMAVLARGGRAYFGGPALASDS